MVLERVDAGRAGDIVSVFCDAFRDYHLMRHVVGPTADFDARLRTLVELFVMTRVRRDDPLLAVLDDGRVIAAATLTVPGPVSHPPETFAHREAVWSVLGHGAKTRYTAYAAVAGAFPWDEAHYHLNMLGVGRAHAGRGLGRRLLDAVGGLSDDHESSTGISLTTENPANLPIYAHMGCTIVGHARVAPELETWGLFQKRHRESFRKNAKRLPVSF